MNRKSLRRILAEEGLLRPAARRHIAGGIDDDNRAVARATPGLLPKTASSVRHLTSAANGVKDLPPGVFVTVDISGEEIRVFFSDEESEELFRGEGPVTGHVEAYGPASDTGPCLNAFIVRHAIATSGWGPLLYDVAMEAAGKRGLTPDRAQVSSSAASVWRYYQNSRSDVKIKQLDTMPGTITPNKKDDCVQMSDDLDRSPLSKVYFAGGKPMTRALSRAKRLLSI